MMTNILPFALLLLFGLACFTVGYRIAARSGREPARDRDDTAAQYRETIQKQSEVIALKESEAGEWKGCYETMLQSYNSMNDAYESMKRAAESYEEASNANRQAYEDMKIAYENLLATVKGDKDVVSG